MFRLGLAPDVYERLKTIAGSRMTGGGELLITARRFRTQDANRQDARRRLAEMIAAAHIVQAQAQGDAAEPCGARPQRVDKQEAAQRGQASARKGGFRLMYDFKIEAADKPTHVPGPRARRSKDWSPASPTPIANMANASALIWETLPDVNWVGFYRNIGGELVLGPFQGRPACIRMTFDAGRVRRGGRRPARSSGSRMSTPFPATSPATARRTARSSFR